MKTNAIRPSTNSGFTFVELIIVVAVVGIIGSLAEQ
jgi:prepilin-type N-terminal cleavage/methylation domain-containing protein